ncbi:uncharacterized protein SAPINGB_P005489 [Magnusiomyces paraingens]|uniref:Uncharacterized protein n=1 Tax=Magnusiomyces paraingens TaxID=2606893 RepID=A0A5E8C212_9ASCO|nr:uncharacterized protein SAPINGB_P005489 [Saprochaete ingens]VVT57010.1 unnamed protein product [Saprochaete ingens]
MSKDYDDELEDLDDFLDEFEDSAPVKPVVAPVTPTPPAPAAEKEAPVKEQKPSSTTPAAAATATTADSAASASASVDDLEAEFASKINLGMDSLIKELEESPEAQEQFQKMMEELAGAMATEAAAAPAAPAASAASKPETAPKATTAAKPASFQDTINQTMNRLNESKQEIDESVKNSETDDFMAKMLKELESAMGNTTAGSAPAGEGDILKMFEEILDSMASKDILYEPIKELNEKYPAWIKDNSSKVSKEDLDRYTLQYTAVREMVVKFETSDYSDNNPAHKSYITERMQIMQNSGNPPPDLMTDLHSSILPNLDLGLENLGDEDNCNTQ